MDFLNFLFKIGCVEYILFESPAVFKIGSCSVAYQKTCKYSVVVVL